MSDFGDIPLNSVRPLLGGDTQSSGYFKSNNLEDTEMKYKVALNNDTYPTGIVKNDPDHKTNENPGLRSHSNNMKKKHSKGISKGQSCQEEFQNHKIPEKVTQIYKSPSQSNNKESLEAKQNNYSTIKYEGENTKKLKSEKNLNKEFIPQSKAVKSENNESFSAYFDEIYYSLATIVDKNIKHPEKVQFVQHINKLKEFISCIKKNHEDLIETNEILTLEKDNLMRENEKSLYIYNEITEKNGILALKNQEHQNYFKKLEKELKINEENNKILKSINFEIENKNKFLATEYDISKKEIHDLKNINEELNKKISESIGLKIETDKPKVAELERKLLNQNKELKSKSDDIKTFNSKLNEKDEEISRLLKLMKNVEKEKEDLSNLKKQNEDKFNTRYDQLNSNFKTEVSGYSEQIKKLRSEIDSMQNENDKLFQGAKDSGIIIKKLEDEKINLKILEKNRNLILDKRNEILIKEKEDLLNELKDLREENFGLREEIKKYHKSLKRLGGEERSKVNENSHNKMKEEYDIIKKNLMNEENKNKDLMTTNEMLLKQITQFNENVKESAHFENLYNEKGKILADTEQKFMELETENKNLSTQTNNLIEELKVLKTHKENYENLYNELINKEMLLKDSNEKIDKDLKASQEKYQNLEKLYNSLATENRHNERKNMELKTENQNQLEEILRINQEIIELPNAFESKIKEYDSEIEALKKILVENDKDLKILRDKIQEKKDKIFDLENKNLSISLDHEQKSNKIKDLELKLKKQNDELIEFKKFFKQQESDLESLKKQVFDQTSIKNLSISQGYEIASLMTEKSKLLDRIKSSEKNNSELSKNLSSKDAELKDIKESNKKQIEELKIRVINQEQEIEVLKNSSENEKIISEIEKFRKQAEDTQNRNNILNQLIKDNEDLREMRREEYKIEEFQPKIVDENKRLRQIIISSMIFK